MTPIFSDETGCSSGALLLACPHCNHAYSHQFAVVAFARKEDARATATVVTTNPNGPAAFVMPPNPSSRRDGVVVLLTCEDCGAQFNLIIEQHKGQTFIGVETSHQ